MGRIVLAPVGAAPAFEMPAEARDWFALLKPRVLTLVVFTAVIGMLVAPGHINPVVAIAAVLCITVAAGAGGRDQHVVRPRHRCADDAHGQSADPGRPY